MVGAYLNIWVWLCFMSRKVPRCFLLCCCLSIMMYSWIDMKFTKPDLQCWCEINLMSRNFTPTLYCLPRATGVSGVVVRIALRRQAHEGCCQTVQAAEIGAMYTGDQGVLPFRWHRLCERPSQPQPPVSADKWHPRHREDHQLVGE
jgi:hypothetical protein